MARKTKEETRIEKATDAAFGVHGNCRQFDMFDLGKIRAAGIAAGKSGQDIEAAVKAACDQYEVKPAGQR